MKWLYFMLYSSKSTVLNNCFDYAACVSLKILCVYINCFKSSLKRFIALPGKWSHLKHLSHTEVPMFYISSSNIIFSLVFYHLLHLNDTILTALSERFFRIGWQTRKFFLAFTASVPVQCVITYHKMYTQHIPRELKLITVQSFQRKHFIPFGTLRTCEVTPLMTQERHHWFLTGLADEEISQ